MFLYGGLFEKLSCSDDALPRPIRASIESADANESLRNPASSRLHTAPNGK